MFWPVSGTTTRTAATVFATAVAATSAWSAMLVLGYFGMRKAKTHEDYLVAGRNLGPTLYMGTMAATVLGGASTVGTVRLGYVHGISGFWLCAALGCGIVALNLFLAKPLLKLKIFTVTQVLEKRYNPMARSASAAIMLAYALMIGVTSILASAPCCKCCSACRSGSRYCSAVAWWWSTRPSAACGP